MARCRSAWLTVTAIVLGCASSSTPLGGAGGTSTMGGALATGGGASAAAGGASAAAGGAVSVTRGAVSSGGMRNSGGGLTVGGALGKGGAAGFGSSIGAGDIAGPGGISVTGGSWFTGVPGAGGVSVEAHDSAPDTSAALDGSKPFDGPIGSDDGCLHAPIDSNQAASLLRNHVFQVQPSMNPTAVFSADELTVPGLWDALQAQVFLGKIRGEDDGFVRDCSFLYGHCSLVFTDSADCKSAGESIASGLVANGAFYYSWRTGSGISYKLLGKLKPSGNGWLRTESSRYMNSNHGPPDLVVAPGTDDILVYRAKLNWESFNDWLDPALIGTLEDFGDRLGIVDSNGSELDPVLPD